jgi:hypothetical protein
LFAIGKGGEGRLHPRSGVKQQIKILQRAGRVADLQLDAMACKDLADDAFEPFSNVVTSRSMNHKDVEFLILARPGRDQWTVVISYPRSTSPTKVPFEGSRDKAIAVARARIDGWLKRQPPSLTPRWPDVTGR